MSETFADGLRNIKVLEEERIHGITIDKISTALLNYAHSVALRGDTLCSGFVAGDAADGYYLKKVAKDEELKDEIEEDEYRKIWGHIAS